MKKALLPVLVLAFSLFCPNSSSAQTEPPTKYKGFLGTYHPIKGTAYGGPGWKEGELMQHAFNFGQNAILVKGSHAGYAFEENIKNSCGEWDVNRVYGIVLPPSEFGAVNQPKDSDLWKPFEKQPGMIQAAHRFSELSKRCPQVAGVIIDDFFNDFPKEMTLENLRDMKDALSGKAIDDNGNVDNSSPATTPHLKLYIVVYEHHLNLKVEPQALELLDGVCFWMWKQTENYKNFDDYMKTVSQMFPNKEVIAGVYVRHSKQTPVVASVHHMIERSIDLYAQGKINGLLIFSAVWLAQEHITKERWEELALPQMLGRVYYPFLGEGKGRVVHGKTKKPIGNALVSVSRVVNGKLMATTRKLTNERGEYRFDGWAGASSKALVDYEIKVESDSFKPRTMRIRLRPGESTRMDDARLQLKGL
ncbi:MAG TPA: carboxypeptidase-like regulatory domain-containing protein [Pyrinomonadaceae bacterium]|nr:carboxypeptidase-like regulatory domain-containing protein [Pyrinomonadaceae bacterium]